MAAGVGAASHAGPPAPMPYREIPDPPDDAERHIVIAAQDRGPVWLLTGFLNNYTPEYDPKLLEGVKPRHWRHSMWPYWEVEKNLPALTTTSVVDVAAGKLSVVLDRVAENEVYAITVSA